MSNTTKGAAGVQGTPTPTKGEKIELSKLAVKPSSQEQKETPNQELEKLVSVEDRKKNFVMFEKLLEKHSKLAETKFKIESFEIGSDEANQTLKIEDINGISFRTGNPTLIRDVIQLIKTQVSEACTAAELEVLKFTI